MIRTFRIAATAFFVVLLVGGILAASFLVPNKEFSVPRVAVDATLDTDGTMHVVEHITYDFTGRFSFGTRPIPVGPYQITDMTVSEQGRPVQSTGAPYNLTFYFSAENETRTFDIAYTVRGATLAGADVDELYWKWVGEDHPTIGLVTATLAVPPGPGRIRAWGHGPLTGVVTIAGDAVRFRAPDVERGRFVEGRVAIPVARLPQLPPAAEPRLPTILAQERAWARAANDDRREAARLAERERTLGTLLTVLSPVLAVASLLGFWLIWRRWGREPEPLAPVGEYHRDLPDDPPAVVDALMHWGRQRPDGMSATVLDLAQRGYLTITEIQVDRLLLPDRDDFELRRTEQATGDLKAFERSALDLVFLGGDPVRHSEIAKHARAHQSTAQSKWKSYKNGVATSLRNRRYINGGRSLPFFLNVLMGIVVGLVGAAAVAHDRWIGIVAIAAGATVIALTPLLRQRTPQGHQRYLEWRGVRNFLRDFSQLAEAPVGHLVLWERYLVYAAALGVSEELAEALATRIPEEEQVQFAPWYVAHRPGSVAFGSIGDFASGLAGATSSFTPPSSGGGGGGGFSGGGGGGGGGGGIGAG